MSAVIFGEGLGLYNSSLNTLGNRGPVNDPVNGRNGNRVYVNAATGNLVVSQQDEFIASLGLDLALTRTYNSLGVADGDNNDNWRLGVHRKLTINAGVSITKVYGDGSEHVFNYNSTLGYYVSTAGEGAHDTIRAEGSNWVWNDGAGDVYETYDSAGKLLNIKDSDGNIKTFSYTGSLVTGISDSSGQSFTLTYSGNNLQSITTSSGGLVRTRVSYAYDAGNRLTTVTVDLTPENTGDTETFITRYTYDGSSKRIATIDYTGGGAPDLSITYDAGGRVETLTDGSGNLTRYTYGSTSTTVTDPLLRQSIYHYDGQKRLIKAETPPLTSGGSRLVTDYVYDASGNITQVKDPTGAIIAFQYDSRGNLTRRTDAEGNVVVYSYTADNLLSSETVYLVADPDYSGMGTITNGAGTEADPQTTYYVYDDKRHLRFVITPEGRVTEHRYAANGTRSATLVFAGNTYSIAPLQSSPTASAMATWAASANLSALERVDYQYDFRGQLSRSSQYSATDSAGAGVTSGASHTYFIYDQRGLLLKSVSPRGNAPAETAATAPGAIGQNLNNHETVYVYDGLGRLISQKDALGNQTTINYDDLNNRVISTFAGGLRRTEVYNNAGYQISRIESDPAQPSADRTAYSLYDGAGQLRVSIDATCAATYFFYDGAGRQVAAIDPAGYLTEFVYDGAGRLLQKLSYATRVSQTLLDQLAVDPAVLQQMSALGQGTTQTASGQFSAVAGNTSATQTAVFTSGTGSTSTSLTVSSAHHSSNVNYHAWTLSGGQLVQSAGVSLAPGSALFNDTTPTEVKATIYRSDGTLYNTVYTQVGTTSTQEIILNTRTPVQPHGYQTSATTDTVSAATQAVTMTVDSTQQYITYTQTSNVQNFGYTYSSSTRSIVNNGSGYSLVANSATHVDNTPTSVRADVYRSDGTFVHTVTLIPGHTSTDWIHYGGYGSGNITYLKWNGATNWDGHVNVGSLSTGNYYAVITTRDDALNGDTPTAPGDDGDNTWIRTNTVNFTIGGQIPDHIDTRLSWPQSVTPAGTSSVTFRYKLSSSSTWISRTVSSNTTSRWVDFDNIANGTYNYEIAYIDAYGVTLKSTAASFVVNGTTDSTPSATFNYSNYASSAATGASLSAFPMTSTEAQSIARLEAKIFLKGTSTQVGTTAVTYPAAHANYFAVNGQYYVNLRTGSAIPNGQYDVQIIKHFKAGGSSSSTFYMEVGLQPEPTNQNHFWNAVNNWNGQVNLRIGSGTLPADTYRVEIAVRDDAPNYGSHNGTTLGSTGAPGADGDATWTRANTVYATITPVYTALQWSNATQPANTLVEFSYRTAGSTGAFIVKPVTLNSGQYRVTLDNLAAGSYEYRIRYLNQNDAALTVLPTQTLDQLRPVTNAADRRITNIYDDAGRLTQTTLATEAGVISSYDGASRLVKTEQAGAITRYFHDKDGRLVGTLDAERYFSEHTYDAAGRLTQTVRYAAQVSTTLQASGTYASIKSAVQSSAILKSCYYYDAQGRQVGRVNEQGFLQETVYDNRHAYREEKQYLTPVTVAAGDTLATLKSRAGTAETTRFEFDSLGRAIAKITADGTITNYQYDQAGRLVQTIEAANTSDARITRTRYNTFGDVTGTATVAGAGVENYAWTLSGGNLAQTTGISLAPGSALFNDDTPTEVKATIYHSDGTVYGTVYTQVGSTATQTINTRAPVQPYGYQASATVDAVLPASQPVTVTVDNTQQFTTMTTSSNVANYGWTYNSSTQGIVNNGSGYSLVANSATRVDNTPTSVRADIYRSDGTFVHTAGLTPGHTSVDWIHYGGYGSGDITYLKWNGATNWNGHVNLGSLEPGQYYAVITTKDEALNGDTASPPGDDGDNTWERSNTVNFTIGGALALDHIDTRISWPESVTPAGTSSVTFRYKAVSSGTWISKTVSSGSSLRYVDIDNIADGTYDYEIVYKDTYGNTLKSATSTFTIDGPGDSTPVANFTYSAHAATETAGASFTAFPMTASEAQTVARIEARVLQAGTSTQVGATAVTYPAAHEDYFAVNGQYHVNLRTGSALPDGRYDVQVIKYYKNGTSATVTQSLEVGVQSGTNNQNQFWNAAGNWNGQVNLKIGSVSMPADTYRVEISVRDDASVYGNLNGVNLGATSAPGADGDGTWQRVTTVYTTFGSPAASAWNTAIDTYGVRYEIDGAGRRIAELGPNGQKTLLYYDTSGRLVYTVNALGEVTATTYNAFGEVAGTTTYSGRISVTGLTGGADLATVASRVAAIANSASDKSTGYNYTTAGRLASMVDAENFTTTYGYNTRGELIDEYRAISTGVTVNTRYERDFLGRAKATIGDQGGIAARTEIQYDGFGRIAQTRDARGKYTSYAYTDSGRTITITDPAGRANKTEYDAYGRVLKSYDGLNQLTSYAYDTANRRITVTTPDGLSVSTWKTRTGEILKVQDRNGGITEYAYTMSGKLATVKDAGGAVIKQNTYDNSGRLFETKDGNGAIIRYTYDTANRVVQRAVDPNGLNLRTSYQFDGQGRQITVTEGFGSTAATATEYKYDRKGQVKQIIVDPAGLQLSTRFSYDGLGNTLLVEQGTVGSPAQKVTQYTFDKLGRKTRQQQDPAGLNIITDYRYDENGNLTRVIHPNNSSTWYGYDDAGKLLREINGLGEVTRHYYDNNGRLTETVRFFNAISTTGLGDTASTGPGAANPSAHANDKRMLYVYDSNNRVRYTLQKVDASNWQVSEKLYDANGNIIESRAFDQYLANSSVTSLMTDGVISEAEFGALAYAGNIAGAGRAIQVHDANNRARYTLTAVDANNWTVTENLYDANGNVIETRRYDKHLSNTSVTSMTASGSSAGGRITEAEMASAMSALGYAGGFGNTQRSFFAYDAANRLRFTVNAEGEVSESVYDAVGNIVAQTRFASEPVLGGVYTEANINAKVGRLNPLNQTTQYVYDKAGNLKQTIDALNKSEYFAYDALGNKTAYTNKNGAVWNYTYDAVGRLKYEISPAVNVIYGTNTTAQSRRLRTEIGYDAMGNVTARTEGVVLLNAEGTSVDNSGARTTAYEYDALGRQVKTTMPGWYDPATGRVEKNTGTGRFQLTSEIKYDALGNAVRNKIRVANTGAAGDYIYQYKTYDGLGRIVHDIDALGNVTTNFYENGWVQRLRRSANALTVAIPNGVYWTAADVTQHLASSADDRIIITNFDRAGRKTAVSQPAVDRNYAASATATSNPASISTYSTNALTRYYYNALGQLTSEEARVNESESARTFHFYDGMNRETATVDAMGYVTAKYYDDLGNLQQSVEYATAVNMTGASLTAPVLPAVTASYNDRLTRYGYDKLNRVTEVSKSSVSIQGSGFGSTLTEVLKTAYDNAGNTTSQTVNGLTSSTEYDALGRVTRVTEPQRVLASAGSTDPFKSAVNVAPVTNYTLDVFGNAVKIERSAAGAMNGATVTLQQKFDHIGNLLETTDGMTGAQAGAIAYEYDTAGRVTREYQFATASPSVRLTEKRYYYDLAGRQLATTAVVTDSAGVKHQSGQRAVYNAFGDIAQEHRVWGAASVTALSGLTSSVQRSFSYDTMGRIVSSQGQDGATYYYYDLQGRVTREEKRGNESAADGTDTRITETVYDLLGRATLQRLPAYTGIAASLGQTTSMLNPKLAQSFDRWGNVISRTDAAGNITSYVYNQDNKILLETLPVTTVWREDGTSYTPTLTHEIHYNHLGLALLEVDKADGSALRSRSNLYNEVGQLTTATDATGVRTEYIYDAMGNRVGTRNELGTVFVDTYNALGQQIERAVLRRSNGSAYDSYGTLAPVKVILNHFEYDAVGRRTLERNYVSTNSAGETSLGVNSYRQYQYNELGNLLQSRNDSGIVTTYKYDAHGNKIEERNALGHTRKWTYSTGNYAFGRLTESVGVVDSMQTLYSYNDYGQVTLENLVGGWDKLYSYHQNGLLKTVEQRVDQNSTYGPNSTSIKTAYDYDILGNRVREVHSGHQVITQAYTNQGGTIDYNTYSYSASFTQLMAYDQRNRLSQVKTLPNGTVLQINDGFRAAGELIDLSYKYDEFGNRRNISASYKRPDVSGTLASNTWYAYDKEGRMLIEDGNATAGGMSIADNKGVRFTYDRAGQRIAEERRVAGMFTVPLAAPEGGPVYYNGSVFTSYTYTDLGLVASQFTEENHSEVGSSNYYHGNYTYHSARTMTYKYDLRGFKLEEKKHTPAMNEVTVYSYHADGRLVSQDFIKNGDLEHRTTYHNYDAAGNLRAYTFTAYDSNGGAEYINTYTYSYTAHNGEYKNNGISVSSDLSGYETGETDIYFDVFGNVAKTTVNNGRNSSGTVIYTNNYLTYNNDGQIIYNHETRTGSSTQKKNSHIYVNGNTVAKLASNGASSFTPFQADKKGMEQGSTPSQYVVQGGETLAAISQTVYGNSRYWYLIADANGFDYGATDALPPEEAGRPLKIPNVVSNKFNDANTFKPYNPAEIIGDLTPSPVAPPPPPKDKSNGFISILMIVVAVVVTIYTAGAAAGWLGAATGATTTGTWAAGAALLSGAGGLSWAGAAAAFVGGFAGSAASQLVGVATGVVDSFDPRKAVSGGLTSVFSMGVGSTLKSTSDAAGLIKTAADGTKTLTTAGSFVQGATGYLGGYAANKIAGLEAHFDWDEVAAASLGAGLTAWAGGEGSILEGADLGMGTLGKQVVGSLTGGVISSSVDRLFGIAGKQQWGQIAADAFGNALANSIVAAGVKTDTRRAEEQKRVDAQAPMTDEAARAKYEALAAEAEKLPENERKEYLSKLRVILFDGTGNRAADGAVDEGTGTNIEKLRDMYKKLYLDNRFTEDEFNKHVLYVPGEGTTEFWEALRGDAPAGLSYGEGLHDAVAGPMTGMRVDERTAYAMDWLDKNMADDANLVVAGFSRGAATALNFLNTLAEDTKGRFRNTQISTLLYDPVASTGLVATNNVNPGLNLKVPADKLQGLRLVSMVSDTEHRSSFSVTRVLREGEGTQTTGSDGLWRRSSADGRIVEVQGLGAHSDVGGGYSDNDNLSILNFVRSLNELSGMEGGGMPMLSLSTMNTMQLDRAYYDKDGSGNRAVKTMTGMRADPNGGSFYRVHDSSAGFPHWTFAIEGTMRMIKTMWNGQTGNDLRTNYWQPNAP